MCKIAKLHKKDIICFDYSIYIYEQATFKHSFEAEPGPEPSGPGGGAGGGGADDSPAGLHPGAGTQHTLHYITGS